MVEVELPSYEDAGLTGPWMTSVACGFHAVSLGRAFRGSHWTLVLIDGTKVQCSPLVRPC
jgi:hypothetical protein